MALQDEARVGAFVAGWVWHAVMVDVMTSMQRFRWASALLITAGATLVTMSLETFVVEPTVQPSAPPIPEEGLLPLSLDQDDSQLDQR